MSMIPDPVGECVATSLGFLVLGSRKTRLAPATLRVLGMGK